MRKRIKRKYILHSITVTLIVVTLLFSFFRFSFVFERFTQSLRDVVQSFKYYFLFWVGKEASVNVTVTKIPSNFIGILPVTWPELVGIFRRFFSLLISLDNLLSYVFFIMELMLILSLMLSPVVLLIVVIVSILAQVYGKVDKKKGDSAQLKAFKKLRRKVWLKIKRFFKKYIQFLKERRYYLAIVCILWLYNLNVITIGLEGLAFLIYASESFDILNIPVQVIKLLGDLTVALTFLPVWSWIIIAYVLFEKFRRNLGEDKRQSYVDKDEKWLENHPGALFFVGKQRSKKTSLLAMMKRVIERMFRKKALKKFNYRNMQFPHFHWVEIEDVIDRCRDKQIKTLEDVEIFARRIQEDYKYYKQKNDVLFKEYRKLIKQRYGYDIQDFIEYAEIDKYPLTYNNGTMEISLFNAIENYGKLYMVYSQPTTLDVSCIPIREDFRFINYGAFKIFDGDLFKASKEGKENKQYSHIIPYDAFRLGKVFNEGKRYDIAVEYGIGVCPEFAKERGNRFNRVGAKKEDDIANQNNDLFEVDTKMRGHIANIDNDDFWRWLFDDQRADALGADNRDMTTIVHIKKTFTPIITLPFYEVDELLYSVAQKIRDKIHYYLRSRKKGDTLLGYIVDLIMTPIFRHFDRIKNQYSVIPVKVKVVDAMDQEVLSVGDKLYITYYGCYNDVFATDSARAFYQKKHRKAKITLNGIEQYKGKYPTIAEYKKQDSYYVETMLGFEECQKERREKGKKKKE